MFKLSEIKDIRRKYKLNENGDIEPTGKEKVKDSSEMTKEEKSYIESAIFLYRKVRLTKGDNKIFKDLSDEEFLEQIQTQFTSEALSSTEYTASTLGITTKPSQVIWKSVLAEEMGAMAYFNRTLAENGKKIQNFQKSEINALGIKIQYNLIDDSKSKFQQSLNPNNPQYTQTVKKIALSQEQRAKRREFVDKVISYYDMMELDNWYKERIEKEDKNMQRVAKIVNNNGQVKITNGPQLFRLLKAAKNLSINGQTDYLEEILSQPEVYNALKEFKNSDHYQKMEAAALRNQREGKVNNDGLREGHSLTQGEKEARSTRTYLKQHPDIDAIAEAKRAMATKSHLTFGTSMEDSRLSNLYSLVARTQGKIPCKQRTLNNIELEVDTGKNR